MLKTNIDTLKYKKRFGYVKNVVLDEKNFDCLGSKFQIIKFLDDVTVKPHYHNFTRELFYVTDGQGIININGEMFICSSGDMVFCEPGDVHSFRRITGTWTILIFKTNEREDDIIWC